MLLDVQVLALVPKLRLGNQPTRSSSFENSKKGQQLRQNRLQSLPEQHQETLTSRIPEARASESWVPKPELGNQRL
ncbi:hypothetical protein CEK71_01970 [Methylovulum psychrotolerans]|uniref:Uncharacterized protein n=1 Tax=Methylovulum psychrotolerans TaxID=1704499 RepID=A0A1Z4BUK3_9GAMM|nr:hypothetical protein CEK71_01970 [Methylovulum psychrotolerans]